MGVIWGVPEEGGIFKLCQNIVYLLSTDVKNTNALA